MLSICESIKPQSLIYKARKLMMWFKMYEKRSADYKTLYKNEYKDAKQKINKYLAEEYNQINKILDVIETIINFVERNKSIPFADIADRTDLTFMGSMRPLIELHQIKEKGNKSITAWKAKNHVLGIQKMPEERVELKELISQLTLVVEQIPNDVKERMEQALFMEEKFNRAGLSKIHHEKLLDEFPKLNLEWHDLPREWKKIRTNHVIQKARLSQTNPSLLQKLDEDFLRQKETYKAKKQALSDAILKLTGSRNITIAYETFCRILKNNKREEAYLLSSIEEIKELEAIVKLEIEFLEANYPEELANIRNLKKQRDLQARVIVTTNEMAAFDALIKEKIFSLT